MNAEQQEKINKALETIENLYPSLPILSKLASLLKDLNVDQSDIIKLVKTDPSLASEIIRVSNRPFYGSKTECSDINNALLIIGQDKVLKVVSLCMSRNLFNQDLKHYGIPADDYWAKSIAAGLLMENLSGPLGMDRDKAYTAGILHSVGMTIINRILDDLKIEMFWDSYIPQIEWEEQITGYNYALAGAEVLKRWKFPDEFTDIIRYHVRIESAENPPLIMSCLNFVVQLLDLLGWKLQFHEFLELNEACREFLEAKQIDEDLFRRILVKAHGQMQGILMMIQ